MLTAILLIAAMPVALDLELGGGFASSVESDFNHGSSAPALQARVGVDLFEHVGLGLTLLSVPGKETPSAQSFCGSPCHGNGSFKALSGLATLRLHTSGDWQGVVEGGVGVGHLISLSDDDLFEDPALHGRGGLALLAGIGVLWFPVRRIAVGLNLDWTRWSSVSRPAFTYGTQRIPAASDLAVSAVLLLFSVAWTPGF